MHTHHTPSRGNAAAMPSSTSGAPGEDERGMDFEIGVCDEGFNLFARIVMRGADGVRRIESNLVGMGYRPVSSGSSAQMRGCDLLMVRAPHEPVLAPR